MTHIHRPAPRPVVHRPPVRVEHHAAPPAKPAMPPSSTAHANAPRPHPTEGPHAAAEPRTAASPMHASSPAHDSSPAHKTERGHAVDRSKSPWGADGFERPARENDEEHVGEAAKTHETNKAFDWMRGGVAPATKSEPAAKVEPLEKAEPGAKAERAAKTEPVEKAEHDPKAEPVEKGQISAENRENKPTSFVADLVANASEAGEAALASVNPLMRQGDLWLRQLGGHTDAITGVDTSRVNDAAVAQRVNDTVQSVAQEHGVNNVGVKVIEPGQWSESLRKQGVSADDHDNIALYDARTHTIFVNSDITRRGAEAQREIIGEELTHADQNKALKDVGPNGTNLAYVDQVGRIFGEAKGEDNGAAVGSALAKGYERLGYKSDEAKDKATHALENWAECDAALRMLWRSHPETNAALKQLCPQMDRVLQREARGESPMRNTEFAAQLKDPARAKDFAKVHGLSESDQKKLERALHSSWVPWHGIERLLDGKYDFSDRVRQSGTVHPGRWHNAAAFTVAAVPSTARAAASSQSPAIGGPAAVGGYPAAQTASARLSASTISAAKASVANPAPAASSSRPSMSAATAAARPLTSATPATATASSPSASGSPWTSVAPSAQRATSPATIQHAQVSAQPIAPSQPPSPLAPPPSQLSTADAQARAAEALAQVAEAQAKDDEERAKAAEARTKAAEARAEARAEAAEALAENEGFADTLDTRETSKDAGHERVTDPAHAPGRTTSQSARFGGDPSLGGRTIDDVVLKATSGSLDGADFELLAHATQTPEGGRNLADALEWMISQPNGDKRVLDLLGQASQPGNTTAMAQALARMAQASPEQTLGLLLLTTDAAGGPAQMARLFGAMADKPVAAAHFATMFEGLTRTPQTAASMSEFLDVVTRASFDDESGARVMARVLRESSTPSGGASNLVKGLSRTLETEGGARSFARVLGRISTSAADSATFLENLSNRESGSETVGRLMARATGSRDGARQVLDSFTRMASANGNEKKTGEVLARIIDSQGGSKFVSNLTSDSQSARQLESLLAGLDTASPAVGDRLAKAFDHLLAEPEAMALRARANESPALKRILERFVDSRATAPVAASSEAPEAPVTQTVQARLAPHGAATNDVKSHVRETARGFTTDDKSQVRETSRRAATDDFKSQVRETSRPPVARLATPDAVDASTPPSPTFRPADVYSQSTLKMARICGDCGFRLTAGGRCVRCESGQAREAALAARTQAVGAF